MKIDMNLKKLTDTVLLKQTHFLVQGERETTIMILRHLREIEVRRLYVEFKHSSMYKFCIKELKYSERQTQSRLSSARLLTELPEIEEQIEAGDLNLTNLSKIQSFVRTEKAANCALDKNEKLELIASLENKSTREVERELVKKSHQPLLMAEKFHMTNHELSQIQSEQGMPEVQYQKFETFIDPVEQDLLQEFKNFYAHDLLDLSNHPVLKYLLEKAVTHKKKKLGLIPKNNATLPSAPKADVIPNNDRDEKHTSGKSVKVQAQRKPLRISIKRQLWQRANGCCEHIDVKTKTRCLSKFALELDHIQPVALGGTNDLVNLQLLCRNHNSRRSMKTFGIHR